MKIAILAILAILVLGGGGAGAYFYFQQPAEAAGGADGEVADAHAKEKAKKEASELTFVEMQPLILPIIDQNGVSQMVSLVIVLEVADSKAATKVELLQPRLKDAYIQELYGVLNRHAALEGGVIKVQPLKEKLYSISKDVVGEDMVDDVLLQVVQQRPI